MTIGPQRSVLSLKELIKQSPYTQKSLAEALDIPEVTINSWASGKYVPSDVNRLILLASALGVSFKTLLMSLGYDVSRVPDDN